LVLCMIFMNTEEGWIFLHWNNIVMTHIKDVTRTFL